jgi:hypothetical protein
MGKPVCDPKQRQPGPVWRRSGSQNEKCLKWKKR